MEQLYDDTSIQIRLDKDHKCIEFSWKKFVFEEEYKKLLEKVYNFAVKYECLCAIPDMTKMSIIPKDAEGWLQRDWFPRMVESGISLFALVNPSNIIAKMNLERVSKRIKKTSERTMVFFSTIEEARDFIISHLETTIV